MRLTQEAIISGQEQVDFGTFGHGQMQCV